MSRALEPLTPATLVPHLHVWYDQFDEETRAHHLALLDAVARLGDVALEATAIGEQRWRVTICTADALGALSIIAAIFTAYRFDILQADIFTVQAPRRPIDPAALRRRGPRAIADRPPSRRLLDIFDVQAFEPLPGDVWERLRADLAALMAMLADGRREDARDEIIDRVAAVYRDAHAAERALLPIAIEIATEPGDSHTRLTVRSSDAPGFLFAFTNALAGFTLNIERAQIRTDGGEAFDTFWVTDVSGKPIERPEQRDELRVATALIKQFTYLLPNSPNPGQALRQFNALVQDMLARPQWVADLRDLQNPAVLETLAEMMGVSRFLWEDFLRLQHVHLFPVVCDTPALTTRRSKADLESEAVALLAEAPTAAAKVDRLNTFKDREMFRIDLRHITGRSDFTAFSEELTDLAEVTVSMAADLALRETRVRFGAPRRPDGEECHWVTLALGKFGGRELGYSSDLELLFVYDSEGMTDGATRIANSEFFSAFVQQFVGSVRARQEGVFEIDLRLRPYGKAGALATALDGFRRYYRRDGGAEQFERMALVRLRPIVGDAALADHVTQARDAFVYADDPLDLGNIHHFRHRQATELVAPGAVNAKYSHGGLVDVEYFVQAWQITVGRRDPRARVTNTQAAIARLDAGGYLPPPLVAELRETHQFLRQLIDALRVVRGNAKDLTIPDPQSREFAYLAGRMRVASPAALQQTLMARMAFARQLWEIAPPPP